MTRHTLWRPILIACGVLMGLMKKSTNTLHYKIECILKAFRVGIHSDIGLRKKKEKIHDLKSSIGLPQNGLDWKTIRDIRFCFA